MRPVLIVLTLVLLVVTCLAGGVLAADWPFWHRAWRWHEAAPAWPASLPGAHAVLRPTEMPRELAVDVDAEVTAAVAELLDDEATEALLVARDDRVLFEYYGAGADNGRRLDGHELALLPVMLLHGAAAQRGQGPALDEGIGRWLAAWREDPRGQITARQLLQGLSGLESSRGSMLYPFGHWARLASGPNFTRAALGYHQAWPPGSHYEANPVDAQLAAATLARSTGRPVAELLREWLIDPLGLDSMRVMLDRPRGTMAAWCCVQARARDWLALALLVAQDGEVGEERIYPERFAQQVLGSSPVAPERALGVQRVTLSDGGRVLLARGRARLLLADPASRSAWLWFRTRELDDAALGRLLAAATRARESRAGR